MQRGILVPVLPKKPHRAAVQGELKREPGRPSVPRPDPPHPRKPTGSVDKGPRPLGAQTDDYGRIVGTGAEAMDAQYHGSDGDDLWDNGPLRLDRRFAGSRVG